MKILLKRRCKSQAFEILEKKDIFYDFHNIDGIDVIEIDDIDYIKIKKDITPLVVEIRPQFNLKLVLRAYHQEDTVIKVNNVTIGGKKKVIIAGPCAIKNLKDTLMEVDNLNKIGIDMFRAGIFKPRTNPYSYQGVREKGFAILKEVKKHTNMLIVSEITDLSYLPLYLEYVDVIQVGARNMQNYALLEALGKTNKPILLKRGFNNTIEEFLSSAEYILKNGNPNVILVERGIRTPLSYGRNALDLIDILALKSLTHLPILIDPSHSSGLRNIVPSLIKATNAIDVSGFIIETSVKPNKAISDAKQTISMKQLKAIKEMVK